MELAVIGTGAMAQGLARLFSTAGHSVTVAGRDAQKAAALAQALGKTVQSASIDAAVARARIVVLAVPYSAVAEVAQVQALSGKIVIDITNPLTADYMGLTIGHTTSAAEQIQALVPGASVVKGFNTVFASLFEGNGTIAGQKIPVYLAADDAAAKATVTALVETTGFAAVDSGALKNARYLEPLAGLNIFFGYGKGYGTGIAPAWLRNA